MSETIENAPSDADLAKAEATDAVVNFEHNGITYELDPDVYEDVEVLELIGEMQRRNSIPMLTLVVREALGERQWQRFKAANRDEKGRVPSSALNDLFALLNAVAGN